MGELKGMNISDIWVRITKEDLMGMIAENLKFEDLKIDDIEINELIKIEGHYIKGIKINFVAILGFGSIEDNILKLRLFNVKVGKIPIWSKIVDFALKKLLNNFEYMGISIGKGTISLNFNLLSKYIPAVDFTVKNIKPLSGEIEVELENLSYSQEKRGVSLDELKGKLMRHAEEFESTESLKEDTDDDEAKLNSRVMIINKTDDEYSKIRGAVKGQVSDKYKDLADYALLIPDIIVLLYRIMRDKRVDSKIKVLIGATIGYLTLPIDILPDFMPVVGKIDDIGIVFFVLDKIIDKIPEYIVMEHWQGNENIMTKAREIREFSFGVMGRKKTISVLSGILVIGKKATGRKKKK